MAQPSKEPKIGDTLTDGTVFAGISPDAGNAVYATPADAPLTMTFNEAAAYAKKLNLEKYLGFDDWRVPTKAELNVLFNNRAAIGGIDVSGSYAAGWYWSSAPDTISTAWGQRLSDGSQFYNIGKDYLELSVRLVRSDAPKVT